MVRVFKFYHLEWHAPYNFYIFDLDSTLVTSINNIDPRFTISNENNWQFYPSVISALLDIIKNYYLIIVTNQSKLNKFKESMIYNIWESLEAFPLIFVSTQHDVLRKPNIGFLKILHNMITEDPKKYFIVGMQLVQMIHSLHIDGVRLILIFHRISERALFDLVIFFFQIILL